MNESLKFPEDIGLLFRNHQLKLVKIIDKGLRAENLGLKNGHLSALFGIDREPGVNGARLAKGALISAQSMNSKLRQLELTGFVERRPNAKSLRADSWYLTDQGISTLVRTRSVIDKIMLHMFAGFNNKELTQLRNSLSRCIDALDSINAVNEE
jgi:DNA-binding MarR family transcriptional regulator